ncbi:hypothetical protein RJ639_038902 [Escallonia herrerae]|uniref:MLO-like protein n=1 Tax=Escallonia herrerae TaxID=1293975 RepID=A0AA89B5L4_9ASTE|nr:hypothetical protein RJ639_038902 [Escallonia herrerae]
MAGESRSIEFTPTWVVALVCFVIVLISLCAERGLHLIGKCLQRNDQEALYEALQKLKEELMLLGFISLLLTVSQGLVSRMCIPAHLANYMLPCKMESVSSGGTHEISIHENYSEQIARNGRRLLAEDTGPENCGRKCPCSLTSYPETVLLSQGKVPLLSLEALHQLHIFIFVLAVVHVIFCATTMVLGGAKLSFFKQFYGSVTKSDYIGLRAGFIREHCRSQPKFDFHKYMLRTLEHDFKKIVGISWYLWLFVVIFLLLNIGGWHTYFWLSFLPLVVSEMTILFDCHWFSFMYKQRHQIREWQLLLVVGAKLEYIITSLARAERSTGNNEAPSVKPSDEHFWFHRPSIVLYLIHFILFQNSFEIAFFVWIWTTYGFKSCIMEKVGYIIPRLVIGVIIQVLCSYSTLPLYALVTQMGSMFKPGIFDKFVHNIFTDWAEDVRASGTSKRKPLIDRMDKEEPFGTTIYAGEETAAVDQAIIELSCTDHVQMSLTP